MPQGKFLNFGTLCLFMLCGAFLACNSEPPIAAKVFPTKVKLSESKPTAKLVSVRYMHRDSTSGDFFPTVPLSQYDSIFAYNPSFLSDGFDFPVGKPNARNYFKAQEFGSDSHLGEDWNGVRGGNTDLGDPVYSISNGLVTFSKNVCCGWGNVIRIVHRLENHSQYQYVESVYAHLHNLYVRPGQLIRRGEQLGTIGNAEGRYTAHLHLEIRDFINMSLGPGYSDDTFGFLVPSSFIQANRP